MDTKPLMWMVTMLLGLGMPLLPVQAAEPKSAPDPAATETPIPSGECVCNYAVHVIFDCAGDFTIGETFIRLSIIQGEYPFTGCEPVVCENPIAHCTLSLSPSRAKSANICEVIPGLLVSQLMECLGGYDHSIICVKPDEKNPGGVFIEASEPFQICLCADEMGLPCEESMGVLVGNCPVYNLLDGIEGNEVHDWREFQSGIGIEVTPAICPDVSPTETPIPTMTWTQAVPPTATFTPVPTNTPTNTLVSTPTPTGESPCVCEYAAHLIFSCTGQFPVDEGSFKLRFGIGAYEGNDCEPVVCEDSIAECTLSLVVKRTKSASLCDVIPGLLVSQLQACLEEQANGIICEVILDDKYPGGIFIQASEPFHICLCSSKAGVPCDGPLGLVLSGCPLYNLGDGIEGNETHDFNQFHAGIGIEFEEVTCSDVDDISKGLGRVDKASMVENWQYNE